MLISTVTRWKNSPSPQTANLSNIYLDQIIALFYKQHLRCHNHLFSDVLRKLSLLFNEMHVIDSTNV